MDVTAEERDSVPINVNSSMKDSIDSDRNKVKSGLTDISKQLKVTKLKKKKKKLRLPKLRNKGSISPSNWNNSSNVDIKIFDHTSRNQQSKSLLRNETARSKSLLRNETIRTKMSASASRMNSARKRLTSA